MIGKVFEENYEWFKRFLRVRFVNLNDYDIEDIVQQVATNLLFKGENLIGIKNLTSYVYTSLQNGAKDYFKKRKNEVLISEDIEVITEKLEDEVLDKELKQVIMKAINKLDENQKFVYIETEIKGRSYDDLVRETGEKKGTLLSRKNRAKIKLKEMIDDYVYVEDKK